jgi:hypothetical protein
MRAVAWSANGAVLTGWRALPPSHLAVRRAEEQRQLGTGGAAAGQRHFSVTIVV